MAIQQMLLKSYGAGVVPWYGSRGLFSDGYQAGNVVQYITIASTGNASNFGSLGFSPYTRYNATGGSVGGGVVYEWNLTSSSYVNLMIKVDNNESIARVTHHDGGNNNTGSFSTSNLGSSRYLKFAFTYQCQ